MFCPFVSSPIKAIRSCTQTTCQTAEQNVGPLPAHSAHCRNCQSLPMVLIPMPFTKCPLPIPVNPLMPNDRSTGPDSGWPRHPSRYRASPPYSLHTCQFHLTQPCESSARYWHCIFTFRSYLAASTFGPRRYKGHIGLKQSLCWPTKKGTLLFL